MDFYDGDWKDIPGRPGYQVNPQGRERHDWSLVSINPAPEGWTDKEYKEYWRKKLSPTGHTEIFWWDEWPGRFGGAKTKKVP